MKTNTPTIEYTPRRPLVDISDRGDVIVIEADMPGVSKDSIRAELKDDELVIAGKTAPIETPDKATALLKERGEYEYARSFVLGPEVDKSSITAEYTNGTLVVTMKKVQPRSYSIAIT